MKCNFEVEHVYCNTLSFEEIKLIICKKLARIIVYKEEGISAI